MSKKDGISPSYFQSVHIKDFLIVEELLLLNNHFYAIDNAEGNIISELFGRSLQKH